MLLPCMVGSRLGRLLALTVGFLSRPQSRSPRSRSRRRPASIVSKTGSVNPDTPPPVTSASPSPPRPRLPRFPRRQPPIGIALPRCPRLQPPSNPPRTPLADVSYCLFRPGAPHCHLQKRHRTQHIAPVTFHISHTPRIHCIVRQATWEMSEPVPPQNSLHAVASRLSRASRPAAPPESDQFPDDKGARALEISDDFSTSGSDPTTSTVATGATHNGLVHPSSPAFPASLAPSPLSLVPCPLNLSDGLPMAPLHCDFPM